MAIKLLKSNDAVEKAAPAAFVLRKRRAFAKVACAVSGVGAAVWTLASELFPEHSRINMLQERLGMNGLLAGTVVPGIVAMACAIYLANTDPSPKISSVPAHDKIEGNRGLTALGCLIGVAMLSMYMGDIWKDLSKPAPRSQAETQQTNALTQIVHKGAMVLEAAQKINPFRGYFGPAGH